MVFSINKKNLRLISLISLLFYAAPSLAGFWELIGADKRLAASAALLTGAASMLGYTKYLQSGAGSELGFEQDLKDAEDHKLVRFITSELIRQRLLDPENTPFVNERTNNFIRPGRNVTPILLNNCSIWQPLVLWQSMTAEGFSGRDSSIEQATAMAAGIDVQEVLKTMQEHTLGNAEAFKDYAQRADEVHEASIAGGSLSCAYQSLKNAACLLRAIFAGDNQEQYNNSLEMLLDLPLSVNLFGNNPSGKWREKIIEMRKQQLLFWFLHGEIGYQYFLIHEVSLPEIDDSGIRPVYVRSIYQQIIGDLNKQKIGQEIRSDSERLEICHSRQEIIDAIKNNTRIYESVEGEQQDINDYLKLDEIINLYILQSEDLRLEIDLNERFIEALMHHYEAFRKLHHLEPVTLDGEDLNDQEFQNLIDIEKATNGLLFAFRDVSFDLIQDDLEFDGAQGLIARLKQGLANDDYCHVIFLHGDHHWLTLIVSKCEGRVDYIIADSLNIPRYGQEFVLADDQQYQNMLVNSELTRRIWRIIETVNQEPVEID